LGEGVKLVVGRREAENARIEALARQGDLLLHAVGFPGPTSLLRGEASAGDVALAAAVTARYGKGGSEPSVAVRVRPHDTAREGGEVLDVAPAGDDAVAPLRIAPRHLGKGVRRGAE
jgi:hypothetical protein